MFIYLVFSFYAFIASGLLTKWFLAYKKRFFHPRIVVLVHFVLFVYLCASVCTIEYFYIPAGNF